MLRFLKAWWRLFKELQKENTVQNPMRSEVKGLFKVSSIKAVVMRHDENGEAREADTFTITFDKQGNKIISNGGAIQ